MATTVESSGRDKLLEAVVKVMELTQKGKLKWRAGELDQSMKLDASDRVDLVYITEYNGKKLEIYRRRWVDFRKGGLLGIIQDPTKEFISEQIILRLATPEGGFWTFPQSAVLRDLMSAVTFQVAGAKDFIDEILSER